MENDVAPAHGYEVAGERLEPKCQPALLRILPRVAVAVAIAIAALSATPANAAEVDWTGTTLPPGVKEKRIKVGSLHTRIYQAGRARSREAVVFVHGNPGSADDWPHLVSVAARYQRAVALDMPGFGEGAKPADFGYTATGEGRFLGRALKSLRIKRAHLVLHDFGGPFGLEWARQNATKVESVVLINTGIFKNYHGHPFAAIWRTEGVGEAMMERTTREGFGLVMRTLSLRELPKDYVDTAWSHFDAATRAAVLKLYRSYEGPFSLHEQSQAQADALRPHKIPALVIWGAGDAYVPAYVAYQQSEAFPGARVELLPAGHFPFVERVDEVDALVAPFWEEHAGDRGT